MNVSRISLFFPANEKKFCLMSISCLRSIYLKFTRREKNEHRKIRRQLLPLRSSFVKNLKNCHLSPLIESFFATFFSPTPEEDASERIFVPFKRHFQSCQTPSRSLRLDEMSSHANLTKSLSWFHVPDITENRELKSAGMNDFVDYREEKKKLSIVHPTQFIHFLAAGSRHQSHRYHAQCMCGREWRWRGGLKLSHSTLNSATTTVLYVNIDQMVERERWEREWEWFNKNFIGRI